MRSAPSPKKKSNLPLLAGGGVAVLLVVMMTAPKDEPAAASSVRTKKKTTAKAGGLYTKADETAKFPALKLAAYDVFIPGVKKAVPPVVPTVPSTGPNNIPSSVTGGDGNWYFTGLVELNGRREALLENTTTGETSYVKSGEGWKTARVGTVDISVVTLVGPDGTVYRVPLQKYGDVAGTSPATIAVAAAGSAPMSLPSGAIGAGVPGGIGVRPVDGAAMRTSVGDIAVGGQSVAAAGQNPNEDGRRRRRNRQNGQSNGDQNNGQ